MGWAVQGANRKRRLPQNVRRSWWPEAGGVVAHAGARLLADLADATGLTSVFSQALAGLRQRQRGHDPGRIAVDLAVMLADGGEAIADSVGC